MCWRDGGGVVKGRKGGKFYRNDLIIKGKVSEWWLSLDKILLNVV